MQQRHINKREGLEPDIQQQHDGAGGGDPIGPVLPNEFRGVPGGHRETG